MERKLASVQTIRSVIPIFHPGDGSLTNLELVAFENVGWQCVVKRGEFQVGDKAIYVEISAIVPEHPYFEFMRQRKFKVKSIRLLGVLSQGLAVPLSVLPQFPAYTGEALNDGDDVTAIIGVTRYEPPQEYKIANGGPVRNFPTDIVPKTDEIRIQSIPHILFEFAQIGDVVATLKVDGTSATYFWDLETEKVRVCSRNMEKLDDDGSVYFLALKAYPQIEYLLMENPELVLQGEIAAPGIQKNRLGVTGVQFFGFNLFNRRTNNYLSQYDLEHILESYDVPAVPVVKRWRGVFSETLDSLLGLAKGVYPDTTNHREGIVLRPYYEERFSYILGGRVSCKVINNDYLLAGGE